MREDCAVPGNRRELAELVIICAVEIFRRVSELDAKLAKASLSEYLVTFKVKEGIGQSPQHKVYYVFTSVLFAVYAQ